MALGSNEEYQSYLPQGGNLPETKQSLDRAEEWVGKGAPGFCLEAGKVLKGH